MKVIVVDDEELLLEDLLLQLQEVPSVISTVGFTDPEKALEYILHTEVHVAFLDINMCGMDGLTLAAHIQREKPAVSIIFLTGYGEYAVDAFKLRASGYIMKPANSEDIITELSNLRPVGPRHDLGRLRVQTFGCFEVFANGAPLRFSRSRSKELFAYLVDRRGASVSIAELASALWEERDFDKSLRNQIHTFMSDIVAALKAVGAAEVVIKHRNSFAVNVDGLECDYYRYLEGDPQAVKSFTGEYMANYSWAEYTTAQLVRNREEGEN